MPYTHDIFISYSSLDAPWAQRLFKDLVNAGIPQEKIFLDAKRLKPGEKWEPSLVGALEQSRHMVVLWSTNAKESDWVIKEWGRFDAIADPRGTGEYSDGRKLIFVSLNLQNKSTGSIQAINDLMSSGEYANGAAGVNPGLWTRVVDQIYQVVTSKYDVTPVNLAILAMTEKMVPNLWLGHKLPVFRPGAPQQTLGEALKEIEIKDTADLLPFYGPEPTDWRPFRNPTDTIRDIMSKVGWQLNLAMRRVASKTEMPYKPLRWEMTGDFWSDTDEAQAERDKLEDGKSVIVIDPLSLYDEDINFRFGKLAQTFMNKEALVMVFAPFVLPTPTNIFRALVNARATRIYEFFYEPAMTGDESFAKCGPDVGDEMDIKRWLLTTIRPRLEVIEKQSKKDNPILTA
jgi:hypothetical protein